MLADPEPFHNAFIYILLSSRILKVEREYPVMFDILQNIGGVSEILLFFFFMTMHIHNVILLDLYMLNSAVLMKRQLTQQNTKLNQVTDKQISSKKSHFEIEMYSYFEVLCYRYFPYFVKKGQRFRQYKRHMDVLRDRMDVRNVVVYEGYSMAVINTLLQPY